MYPLRYLPTGHIFISPQDDCDLLVDAMLATDYGEEFCLAGDFSLDFAEQLMEAGFLVMSAELGDEAEPFCLLLPKLHLIRSVLFFPDLHIPRRLHKRLSAYELRVDQDFDLTLDNCIAAHGDDWLTPPLAEILKGLHKKKRGSGGLRPVSFGVYREGELRAGEVGVIHGGVYTSYSGYYHESHAGNVQMVLMVRWLQERGFRFLDFGMPLDYKTALGARNIDPQTFVSLFREARSIVPKGS